jgi:hypothetical protein
MTQDDRFIKLIDGELGRFNGLTLIFDKIEPVKPKKITRYCDDKWLINKNDYRKKRKY